MYQISYFTLNPGWVIRDPGIMVYEIIPIQLQGLLVWMYQLSYFTLNPGWLIRDPGIMVKEIIPI